MVPPEAVRRDATSEVYQLDCSLKNWIEDCLAHASSNDSPSKTEVDIAVNPKDPNNVFLASKDLDRKGSRTCVWSVGQVTHDAGKTWKTVYVGGTEAEREDPRHPLAGWDCITDPILAFDKEGILYYGLQAYELADDSRRQIPAQSPVWTASGSGFFLAISRDGGDTFPTIIPLALGDGIAVLHDFPRMATNPASGAVGTIWNAGSSAFQVIARNGGSSRDAPVYPGGPGTGFWGGYTVDKNGAWYVLLQVGGSDDFTTLRSTDDGKSYQPTSGRFQATRIAELSNAKFRAPTFFELTSDFSDGPFSGRLYCVWADGRNKNADVYFTWSDDGAKTWAEPRPIDDHLHDQFMSRPVVDGRGTLHVVYLDRKFDPENRLLDATHAWTEDGGATWTQERLTTLSFDGDLGRDQEGGPFIGDYIGISAVGNHVWMAFPHTGSGRAEIAAAHSQWIQ